MKLVKPIVLSVFLLTGLGCGDDDTTVLDAAPDVLIPSDADLAGDMTLGEDATVLDAQPDAVLDAQPDMMAADAFTQETFAMSLCTGIQERDVRCGRSPGDLERCLANDDTCVLQAVADEGAKQPYIDCISGRGCSESDDICVLASRLGNTPVPGAAEFQAACRAKSAECSITDDFCFVDLISAAALSALEPCLELDCNATSECIGAVFSPAECQ